MVWQWMYSTISPIYCLPGLVNIHNLLLQMAIEIVDLPINSMVIFHSYVSLPEGIYIYIYKYCIYIYICGCYSHPNLYRPWIFG